MKKIVLLSIAGLFSLSTQAQKTKASEIPAGVKTTFENTYPQAKEVKWEKEDSNYEVEFEIGESEQSVTLSAGGSILETEVEIKVSELPTSVSEYVNNNYKGAKIKEASKITDAAGKISYEADIKSKDLIFDGEGKFLREENDKDKDDEKD